MKASDVFGQSKPFLGGFTSEFDRAFPEIEKVVVEVEEEGDVSPDPFGGETTKKRVYGKSTLPGEYIDCSNPRCYNGGFRLSQTLRFMVDSRETNREEIYFCQGYEGSPKGRVKYDDCDNRFKVKITVVYKEETPDA